MALQTQTIPISFAKGLDTKTDPDQIQAGNFLALSNVKFGKGMSFQKRNGYQELLSTTAKAIASYNDELVLLDGKSLYSYSPALGQGVNKGNFTSVDVQTSVVARSSANEVGAKSAYSAQGYFLHTWIDQVSGPSYCVVSQQTGTVVLGPTLFESGAGATIPFAFCIGKYFLILYTNFSLNEVRCIAVSTTTLIAMAPFTVASSSYQCSGAVQNDRLYVVFIDSSTLPHALYIDSSLNISYQAALSTFPVSGTRATVSTIADNISPHLWVTYTSSDTVRGIQISLDLSVTQDMQLLAAPGGANYPVNITGFSVAGLLTFFVEMYNTYPVIPPLNYVIESSYIQSGTSGGASQLFLRGCGIISHCFSYNGNHFLIIAYQGGIGNGGYQPTYFLVNQQGIIIAKLINGNGGGYNGYTPAQVNVLGNGKFQVDLLEKDSLNTQSGFLFSNTGIDSIIIDFDNANQYQNVTLGKVLNLSGGFLWQYDGNQVCENNFHLFPEDILGATSSNIGTTAIAAGDYQYQWIYQWTDNAGQVHRSAPAPAGNITVGFGGTSAISFNIPTLRLTNKNGPVMIMGYRTAPSLNTGSFYRTTPFSTSALISSTAVDYITWNDTNPDSQIADNDILYTTGGILEDIGGPASGGMTNFKNRLFLINAEDRNQLWYSKTTLEATPVEMSDSQTFYVDPRWGIVTAISVLDDKLIIFKESAIFYVVGSGPDATGNNNDFSDAIFVTSIVGCSNPNSIIMTQSGLMFQSDKGIWLLSHDLQPSYIGAPVEAYNGYTVTSALVIPGTTQIRFTLDGGPTLVYDYFYQIWGTFSYQGLGAVIFGNLFTFIGPDGINQETLGTYSDNGTEISRSLTTGWLAFAGIQGFQRARKLFLMAEYLSPHTVQVGVAYDYENGSSQNAQIIPSILYNGTWGSNPFYGSGDKWGGPGTRFQYEIDFIRQKCQAIQISLTETLDPNNPVFGPGSNWVNMAFVVGKKLGYPKLSAERKLS